MESVGTKIFLQKVDRESCEWKRIGQILIVIVWDVTHSVSYQKQPK